MEQTDSYQRGGGSGGWMKEGEGSSQRTFMHDPWMWTMVWELPEGVRRRGLVQGGQRGEIGTM